LSQSAIAAAFTAAGYRSTRERLDEIADAALAEHPRTLDAARAYVLRTVMNDAVLLWTMFERWHGPAADMLLQAAAARRRAKSEAIIDAKTTGSAPPSSGANGVRSTIGESPQRAGSIAAAGPSPAAREEARSAVARVISKLDTFKINGRPIGDCTPEEAMGWRAARVRDARFVYLLASNLPPGRPIRDFIRPEEAEQFYARAMQEHANE
jgi:hypothetical protein